MTDYTPHSLSRSHKSRRVNLCTVYVESIATLFLQFTVINLHIINRAQTREKEKNGAADPGVLSSTVLLFLLFFVFCVISREHPEDHFEYTTQPY